MSPVLEAIQRGASRGTRLALNPTIENYRSLTMPTEDTVTSAWRMTGKSLRMAMETERERENKESSSRPRV